MAGIELKFQVPAAQGAAVHRALATATAQTGRLRARYFDTLDRRLAAAGLMLRLQQADGHWTQALEGRVDGHLPPRTHEVPVGGRRGTAELDIARHAGTPAGEALAAALGNDAQALQVVFETDVRRTRRVVRSAGARVEMSFDVGEIRAGDAQVPACALQFTLRSGQVTDMVALAARWIDVHSLWLDVRSMAERGDRLARGINAGPPVRARGPFLKEGMAEDAALRALIGACIEQLLPNAAETAAGTGGPEHLHQTRIGLRRLRSALRVFGDWSAAVDPAWRAALADLFARLGSARDRDVIAATLLPELRAAGAPLIEPPPDTSSGDAGEALRSPQFGKLILNLFAFAHSGAQHGGSALDAHQATLTALVGPRLERMHRQLKKDAAAFLSLDDAMRHRTRKRLKRLRYCVEFVASLYRAKAVRHYLARLQAAQDVLGQNNDLTVAEAAFRKQLEKDARAWFTIGYLAARRPPLLQKAARALESLAKAPRFW